jgi:uncharacterized protein
MPMLQLGEVTFSVSGLHYDKLKHSFKAHWARHKRFGRRDAMQATGIGEDDVHITGTIYLDYYPGFGDLAVFRRMSQTPQMLVSGAGDVFGRWCILSLSNEQTFQDARGVPGKVTFELHLTAYGEDEWDGVDTIIGLLSADDSGTLAHLPGADVGAQLRLPALY